MTTPRATDLLSRPPLESRTVAEAFQRRAAQSPDRIAIRTTGGTESYTWRELDARVRRVAAGLSTLGIGHGDTVAMLIPNTIELHLIDYAALHLGAVPFAIFNSSSADQIAHQVRVSDTTVVVTALAQLPRVRDAIDQIGGRDIRIILVDGGAEDTLALVDLERRAAPDFDFDATWRAVEPDDIVTLIFTSGTTGAPKAAHWSHAAVLAGQRAMDQAIPVTRESVVSFLPMAHAGGRVTVHYMVLSYGATITVCPDMSAAGAHFVDARPDAILSVPRVFEKLQVAIETFIDGIDDDDQRARAVETVEIGKRLARASDSATSERIADAERARLEQKHAAGLDAVRPVLARLGLDRVRSAIVGGAPASAELARFYRAIGVPFIEAYGSTEASLVLFNRADDYKTGTAGKPLPGVEIRLLEDGELLIRSASNFTEYRGQPDQSAAALDEDGWLHTGDIATIDEAGFVAIVDRKKEIMISSSGKNMSPANIESALRGQSSLIAQVVSIGDRRNYVTALITLDPEAVAAHARAAGIVGTFAELTAEPSLAREVQEAVARGNEQLSRPEQVRRFTILPAPWAPDGDELTPTGKLKRRQIAEKYTDEVEALYTS